MEADDKVDDGLRIYVEELIARRIEAKENKDYAMADQIREELKSKGINIKDTAKGTEWEVE